MVKLIPLFKDFTETLIEISLFSESKVTDRVRFFTPLSEKMRTSLVKSVQSALSDLKRPPERLQSQCNYRPFIT